MKHHPSTNTPTSFLQGQELEILGAYVRSYLGVLHHASVQLPSGSTRYIDGGSGPVIILLHGIGSKKSHFRSTMKTLCAEGFRVIAPDVPGIYPDARLPAGKHNLRNLSLWLKNFTDALGIQEYALIGNSLGASFAAYHAEQYPDAVQRLALLSMPATFNAEGEDLKTVITTLFMELQDLEDVDELISCCFFVTPQLPRVVRKKIREDVIKHQDFVRQLLEDIRESQLQLINKLKRIAAPTLLISGENDPICPPEFSAWIESQIPQAELHLLAKSKHLTFIERHRLVIKLLSDFLQPWAKEQPAVIHQGR